MNVFFHTFGCRANQYDTARVRQAFVDQGAVVVEDPARADLAVVNSCTVTAESEAKLRQLVRGLARRRPALETVVMGCAAATGGAAIARLPSVRAVVAGGDAGAVLSAAGWAAPASPAAPLRQFGAHARGWLRIQDGCDEHCTFCATVVARGAGRSRPVTELVEEARALATHHAELVLTGIHIGTYGRDWSAGRRGPPALGVLLEALVAALPEVRFRLSSIEATEIDDRIAHLLIEAPRQVAPHLHAPLQSGSDCVLRRMGRHWYTARSYQARLEWLAARLPVFGLGADVIAGFPGETDADHRATLALLEALPFSYLHVFPFSARPGASARRLSEAVSPAVRRARAAELRACGTARATAHRARRSGAVADGVASGRRGGQLEIVTEDYLSVSVPIGAWDGRRRFPVTVV